MNFYPLDFKIVVSFFGFPYLSLPLLTNFMYHFSPFLFIKR